MKNEQMLISEISEFTKNIESNYPELYKFLDENPITIPSESDPIINITVLEAYLESLKQLLKHHINTRRN